MKITCLTDEDHNEFYVTVVVNQEWLVDKHGNFLEEGEFIGTINGPTSDKEYTCKECGGIAWVTTEGK